MEKKRKKEEKKKAKAEGKPSSDYDIVENPDAVVEAPEDTEGTVETPPADKATPSAE